MSEALVLYLFTRVDDIRSLLFGMTLFGTIATAGYFFFVGMLAEDNGNDGFEAISRKRPALFIAAIVVLALVRVAVPSQKDLAIIVGGVLAVDAAKSTTAKKLLDLVNVTIDAELEKALKKEE